MTFAAAKNFCDVNKIFKFQFVNFLSGAVSEGFTRG